MNKWWEYIKTHKWTVAAIIAGLIILYYLYVTYSGQSATTVYSNAPTDAEVSAAAAVQQAEIAANAQTAAQGASLTAQGNQLAAELAAAQLQSQTANLGITTQGNVQQAGIQAAQTVQLAGLQTQQNIAGIEANVQLANMATYTTLAAINAKQSVESQFLLAVAQSQASPARVLGTLNLVGPSLFANPSTTVH